MQDEVMQHEVMRLEAMQVSVAKKDESKKKEISLSQLLLAMEEEGISVTITDEKMLKKCKKFVKGNLGVEVVHEILDGLIKQGYCVTYPIQPNELVKELLTFKKVSRMRAERVVNYFKEYFTDQAECRVICIYVVARITYGLKAREVLRSYGINFDALKKSAENEYYSNEDFKDHMDYDSFETFDHLLLNYKRK